MACERIIGSSFIENENRATAAVTGASYRKCIQKFLKPEMNDININMWFTQDGATANTAKESIQLLKILFPHRLISPFFDVPWVPRPPDLTHLHFFLWIYLNETVYVNRPISLEDLKANIYRDIRSITLDLLRKVMNRLTKRMRMCIDGNGNHLKGIIFK